MGTSHTGIIRNSDTYLGKEQDTLYNYWAVSLEGFGINGWHVPTRDDFEYLLNYIDDSYTDNYWLFAGSYLKQDGLLNWDYYLNSYGNDAFGFSALGVGTRGEEGTFSGLRKETGFWTATEYDTNQAYFLSILYSSKRVEDGTRTQKKDGLSVRLIKNDSTLVSTVSDNDGHTYNCVKIGTQVWMKDNFAGTKLIDNSPLVQVKSKDMWAAMVQPAYCYFNNNR